MEHPTSARTRSGRDPKKAAAQSAVLGANKPVRQPQSHYLVICGGTQPRQGWIFSDFMGYCMMLKEFGVEGDFYSCFPLSDHFVWLNNENKPSIHDIKFGRYGPDGKALYTYTRQQWCAREYWWTQMSPKTIHERFKDWVLKKQKETEPGDTVNIIFTGHGTFRGEFCIGEDLIHPATFTLLLSKFKEGVQVNAVSDACYSGMFINIIKSSNQKCRYFNAAAPSKQRAWSDTESVSGRLRNGRFAAAFVQSMARMKLPGPGDKDNSDGWRIQDHEEFMKTEAMRKFGPGSRVSEPQFWSSSDIDRSSLLRNLLFQNTMDISYDQCAVARRRRKEWPTSDEIVRQALSSACTKVDLPTETKAMIEAELARCDTQTLYTPDLGVYTEAKSKEPNWRAILRNLYWRARRQSAVWDVYELLVDRGFVDPKSLQVPMDLLATSEDVDVVLQLLACFSGVGEASVEIARGQIPEQWSEWVADLEWLATVIVRSGANLDRLFQTIEASQFLGSSDEEELKVFRTIYPEAKINQSTRDREGPMAPNGEVPPGDNVFGFWLPHGLQDNDPQAYASQLRACHQRFNAIERAFREVEGISPHDLVLETEQGMTLNVEGERE